jgi:hypothetical protein
VSASSAGFSVQVVAAAPGTSTKFTPPSTERRHC